MKIPSRRSLFRVILLTAAVLSFGASARAAKIDFSEFEGKYNGTWLITATNVSIPASVAVSVRVNKPGDEMTVDISGIGSGSGTSFPILATYKFKAKNRRLIASSPLLGFVGPAATLPARFGGSKNTFTFTTLAAPGASLLGFDVTGSFASFTVRFTKNKMTVLGSGSLVQTGTPQAVQFFVTLSKSKKKGGK